MNDMNPKCTKQNVSISTFLKTLITLGFLLPLQIGTSMFSLCDYHVSLDSFCYNHHKSLNMVNMDRVMFYMDSYLRSTFSSLLNCGSCSYLRRGLGWHLPKVVGFELFTSLVMAFISWQLFATCQRPSA